MAHCNVLMAISHCTGTGPVQGMGTGAMGPNSLYRNVHIGPRHGKEPEPIVAGSLESAYWFL